jgi:predicted AAA+ superfamily ATPase
MYKRALKISLPSRQSAFLWGARQTGKSTYLKSTFPDSYRIDLLRADVFSAYLKNPSLLRETLMALPDKQKKCPIIIDEVQKVPALLDEVHALIEDEGFAFILCGSSARKLKRGGANLLGGRAWRFECFPLTSMEIPNFDLTKALQHGLLPKIYDSSAPDAKRSLRAYGREYLQEEIQAEGLVRNLKAFAKFLDMTAFCSGEMLNYTKIAADSAVDQKTVKNYFQILYDTLIAYEVLPFVKNKKRDIVAKTPKFYLFDTGVLNQLAQRDVQNMDSPEAGKLFEHWVLMELMAYRGYREQDFAIQYWRTKTGLEVDFVLGDARVAIEVKLSKQVRFSELRGLRAFKEEQPQVKAYVVSFDAQARLLQNDILVLPWKEFVQRLWADQLIS